MFPQGEGSPPRAATGAASGIAVASTAAAHLATVASSSTTSLATSVTALATSITAVATAAGIMTTETAAAAAISLGTTLGSECTNITVGSATSTSTGASTTTGATAKAALTGNGLEERRHILICFLEQVDEVSDNTAIAAVEESGRSTSVTSTTSTTNTMNVVVNVGWKIVIDNMGDVGNVKTTSSNSGSNKNWAVSSAEHLQSTLALTLSTIAVNGGSREMLVDEEVAEIVGHALGLDEDQGQSLFGRLKDVKQDGALIGVLDVFNALGNVLRSGANTTNRQEDVVLEEIAG